MAETKKQPIPQPKVHQKILNIMSDVKYMQKDGKVQSQKMSYNYLSAEKIIENVRVEIIKQKLIIYPCLCLTDNTDGNQKDITITYRILAVEDGSFIDVQVTGGGHDSMDKKSYKAMTGAFKYALRQTFMIETGKDDPDKTPSGKTSHSKTTEEKDPFAGDENDYTDDIGKDQRLCTDKQLKRLYAMMKEAAVEIDEWDKKIKSKFKIEHKKEMTMTEIDKVFDSLEEIIKKNSQGE